MPSRTLLRGRLAIAGDLFRFLWERKLWWMVPLVAMVLALGAVIFLASQSPVAPFVYTLF